jgi:AbrB family looped-hinge helix DNA binding protein
MGRVIVPAHVRRQLNLVSGDLLVTNVENGAIVMRPYDQPERYTVDEAAALAADALSLIGVPVDKDRLDQAMAALVAGRLLKSVQANRQQG